MSHAQRDTPNSVPSARFDLPRTLAAALEPMHCEIPPGPLRPAAVVALLLATEDGLGPRLVLIERASMLRAHAGQLALPGGKPEPGDTSLWETALREAEEEVGLARASVTPLGRLSCVPTPSGFFIVPFVARVDGPWEPTACCAEVSRVLTPSLTHLLAPGVHHMTGVREYDGRQYALHRFEIHDPPLWGATAIMVWDLLERMRRAADPDDR